MPNNHHLIESYILDSIAHFGQRGKKQPKLKKMAILCETVNSTAIGEKFPTMYKRKAVDSDEDGEITKEEFVAHALKSRFLQKMLEN